MFSLGSVIRLLLITSLFSLLVPEEKVVANGSELLLLLGWERGGKGLNVNVFQLTSSKNEPRKTVAMVPFLQK